MMESDYEYKIRKYTYKAKNAKNPKDAKMYKERLNHYKKILNQSGGVIGENQMKKNTYTTNKQFREKLKQLGVNDVDAWFNLVENMPMDKFNELFKNIDNNELDNVEQLISNIKTTIETAKQTQQPVEQLEVAPQPEKPQPETSAEVPSIPTFELLSDNNIKKLKNQLQAQRNALLDRITYKSNMNFNNIQTGINELIENVNNFGNTAKFNKDAADELFTHSEQLQTGINDKLSKLGEDDKSKEELDKLTEELTQAKKSLLELMEKNSFTANGATITAKIGTAISEIIKNPLKNKEFTDLKNALEEFNKLSDNENNKYKEFINASLNGLKDTLNKSTSEEVNKLANNVPSI